MIAKRKHQTAPRRAAPAAHPQLAYLSCRVRRGFSLVELLAIVALIGILAAILLVRIGPPSAEVRARACNAQRGDIEIQVQLFHRNTGSWPAADLSDIGGQAAYFPEGLPTCPVDGSAYTIDPTTHHVVGHDH